MSNQEKLEGSKNLLVRLETIQNEQGCISPTVLKELSVSLNIPLSEVYGVATFYSFLSVKPRGKFIIRVCKSLPCHLKNSEKIIKSIEDKLGIAPGETTRDGKFSLELTNCIGACDVAPAMLINDKVHGNLTHAEISRILKVV